MHGSQPANHDLIADFHVPSEGAIVGKDDRISDDAIMRNMTVSEKISAAADPGCGTGCRAAIHRSELAKRVFLPDLQRGRFTGVFEVLGLLTNGAEGVEAIAAADLRRSGQADMVLHPAIRP